MTERMRRVNESVRQVLSEALPELKDPRIGVVRQLAAQVVERQERVLAGRVGLAAEEHDAVLAEPVEPELRAEDRAERVAVRVLVRDEQEAVVGADRLRDRGEVSCRRCAHRALEPGRRSASSSGRPARPTDRIRT